MGSHESKEEVVSYIDAGLHRAEGRVGIISVSGRYQRSPNRIEDDYIIEQEVLGTGHNGSVLRATDRRTGAKYAVKGFHLLGVPRAKLKQLEAEAEIFLTMDHPHIARLASVYESDEMLYLVMECMEGGELFDRVAKLRRFTEADAANALYQMLLALNYIHSHAVVHRDLKLENWLYEAQDSDILKLIDFGFSRVWSPNTKMATSCGTLAYVAPEVLKKSYTSQCDLWSLGVIAFVLLLGHMPFHGTEEVQICNIKMGSFHRRRNVWLKLSLQARDFLEKLLTVDPTKRLNAEEALMHKFVQDREANRRTDVSSCIDDSIVSALLTFREVSQFRRACLAVMAWSLTNEERSEVRDAFLEMDNNNRGTITLAELKTVLTSKYAITDDQIRNTFDALDTGGNEEIHYTEFLAAMVSTRIAMHDDLLAATFRRFDIDRSGFISRQNLATVLGESFDGTTVNSLLEEADADKDGLISYEKFIHYMKQGRAPHSHSEVADRLIDTELGRSGPSTHSIIAAITPTGVLGLRAHVFDRVCSNFFHSKSSLTLADVEQQQPTATQSGRSRICQLL